MKRNKWWRMSWMLLSLLMVFSNVVPAFTVYAQEDPAAEQEETVAAEDETEEKEVIAWESLTGEKEETINEEAQNEATKVYLAVDGQATAVSLTKGGAAVLDGHGGSAQWTNSYLLLDNWHSTSGTGYSFNYMPGEDEDVLANANGNSTASLYSDGDLSIVVKGNCVIESEDPREDYHSYGIFVDGKLFIDNFNTGGSYAAELSVTSGTTKGSSDIKSLTSAGIFAQAYTESTLNLTDETKPLVVNANGGDATYSYGLYTGIFKMGTNASLNGDFGEDYVLNVELHATGGEAKLFSYGLYVNASIYLDDNQKNIVSGKLTATGGPLTGSISSAISSGIGLNSVDAYLLFYGADATVEGVTSGLIVLGNFQVWAKRLKKGSNYVPSTVRLKSKDGDGIYNYGHYNSYKSNDNILQAVGVGFPNTDEDKSVFILQGGDHAINTSLTEYLYSKVIKTSTEYSGAGKSVIKKDKPVRSDLSDMKYLEATNSVISDDAEVLCRMRLGAEDVAEFDMAKVLPGIRSFTGATVGTTKYKGSDVDRSKFTVTNTGTTVKIKYNDAKAEGDTAEVTLGVSGGNYLCDVKVSIEITNKIEVPYTVTVENPRVTFGESIGTVTVKDENDIPVLNPNPYLTYSGTLRDGSAYAPSGTAPTAAGEYTVKYYQVYGDYINEGEADFVILPKSIESATIEYGEQATYDGNEHEVVCTIKVDDVELERLVDFDFDTNYKTDKVEPLAVVIYAYDTGNYDGSIEFEETWSLKKATPKATDLVFYNPSERYTGEETEAEVRVKDTVYGFGDVTVLYDGKTEVPVKIGKYKISVTVAEGDNYTATSEAIEMGDFEIVKGFDPARVIGAPIVSKGGTIDLNEYVAGNEGNLTFETASDKITLDSKGELKAGNDTGKYDVTVKVAESTNYQAKELTISVEVTAAAVEAINVTMDNYKEDETPSTPKYTVPEGGAVSYAYHGITKDREEYTNTAVAPAIAGDYSVTVRYIVNVPSEVIYTGSADFKVYTSTTRSVSFNMCGHGDAIEVQKIESGKKATKPADPAAEGYVFGGWYADADYKTVFDFTKAITADTVIYAKWIGYCTVSFNMCGHGKAIDPQKVEPGKTASKPEDPTAEGFTFGGWYADAEYKTAFDFSKAITADTVIYAKWIGFCTVSFNMCGHGKAIEAVKVEFGKTIAEPAKPEEEGYVFGGWFTDEECTKAFDFTTTITTDITLYAKWIKLYTVSFNMCGHGDAIEAQKVEEGKTVTKPADPKAEGYDFLGWYKDAECTGTCTNIYDFSAPVTADITLYAKWELAVSAMNPVPEINENTTEIYLVKGQKFYLDGKWISDMPKVVNISKKGLLTAKKVTNDGQPATIKLAGTERSIKVYVTIPKFAKKKVSMDAGLKNQTLSFTYDKHMAVQWTSSAPDVATVSQNGLVNAVAKGKATITAYVNGKAYSCTVSVKEHSAATERTLHLNLKKSKAIKLKGVKANKIEWKVVSGNNVVSFKKSKFIASTTPGSCTVKGTAPDGKVYTVYVTVEDPTIKTGTIQESKKNKYKVTLEKAGAKTKIAFNHVEQPVTFKSKNGLVAYVDKEGNIVANGKGSTTLTAKINKQTVTIKVTVNN